MFNVLRTLRKGSIEKRVVRACLFSSIQGRVIYDMMTTDINAMDSEINDGDENEVDGERTSREPGDSLAAKTTDVSHQLPPQRSAGVSGGEDRRSCL